MDLRKSLSKPFKKLKDKLPGGGRKRDGGSGSENRRKAEEADFEGSEASRRNSYLHSEVDIKGVAESGPSQDGNNASGEGAALVDDPPASTPPISQSRNPDGM